jgi:Domain of unknown function (DUF4434)
MRTRRHATRAPIVAALLLAALAEGAGASPDREACRGATRLRGTFVQLTTAAAERPRAEWDTLFAEMRAIGVEQVFLQWTWADGVAFYASPDDRDAGRPIVGTLFDLAAQHGMRVWVGLAHDAGWWAGIDRSRPATEVEVFLARRRLQNLSIAQALSASVAAHPAFAGWYAPDEIDDRNWLGRERTALVAGYLEDMTVGLRNLTPGAAVAASGFGQGWAAPTQLADQWSAIVARARIDLVLFQDGIGAGKLTLADAAAYLPPLEAAVAAAGGDLGVVVELFSAAPTTAEAATAFAAEPAPLERIAAQLAQDQRWATGPLVAFSVPDYMSSLAGARGAALYAAYRGWREGCARGR